MVISCMWARGDQESDKRRANAEWLFSACKRAIERLVRQRLLVLEGFDYKEFKPEGVAPVSDPQWYVLTFPTAEGHLAMRQTALDEWSVKFARLKRDFDEAVDTHNKEFNPSGFPYKADGQKRAAPGNIGRRMVKREFPSQIRYDKFSGKMKRLVHGCAKMCKKPAY